MPSALPLAVGVLIEHEGRFLMIRRARDPFRGWWSPVTGRVETGESLEEAGVREVAEEMSLHVEVDAPFHSSPTLDGSHMLHFMSGRWISGSPIPRPEEVSEWCWVDFEQMRALTPSFDADVDAFRLMLAAREKEPGHGL